MSEDKKYELVPDKDTGLFRVKALRDIPYCGVKAGDVGGLVAGQYNLSQAGDCWVGGDAQVLGNASVSGYAHVNESATVKGHSVIRGNARVRGRATVDGYSGVTSKCIVAHDAQVTDTDLWGRITVWGNARIRGNFILNLITTIGCDADITTPDHVLTLDHVASRCCSAILYRTKKSYRLEIGCWAGTVQELHALADSDNWPSKCDELDRETYRPQLHAVADLCAAQIRLWGDRDV